MEAGRYPASSNDRFDSNTVTDILAYMNRWTIQELAEAVNAWCRDRTLQPANGQAASELSARTLHYYRSAGLLDAPESGAGRAYGRRHLLQLKAIRILQAHGLPLSRIQQLLFARSEEELQKIAESAGKIDAGAATVRSNTLNSKETWTIYPLNEQLFVVARNGALLSTSQLEAIGKICDAHPKKSSKTTRIR
jgi:DNA-binding transcriptional MerR regulator